MKYALVDVEIAKDYGFDPYIHRITDDKMVVNENELMSINKLPETAARTLGAQLLSEQEIFNILNNNSHEL